jgi:hypothetical protein
VVFLFLSPKFGLEIFAGVYWGRQKKQVKRLFFCTGIIRFDFVLHMIFFHIAYFLIIIIIKIIIKNLWRIYRIIFSLAYQIIACIFS